jgi:DNA-binding XRE family transcriptional regulator
MGDTAPKKANGNKVLREVREKLELSQPDFAQKVGLSEAYISYLENGRYTIGAEAALKIWNRFRAGFEANGYELEDLLRSGRKV